VRIRGALHVHSTFSHDGTLSVAELAQFYAQRGFDFIAIGEHSQDMDAQKVRALVEQSSAASHPGFLVIPGIEYTCDVPGMHILGLGALLLAEDPKPLTAVRTIHESDGYAVLAHPRRFGWQCPAKLVSAMDAVEIWNVGYDGKYLPSVQALRGFREMKAANSKLLGVASHDLHREPGFYDVGIDMEVAALERAAVLANMRAGAYKISSRYFSSGPHFEISWRQSAFLHLLSAQLSHARQMRALVLRRSA
jgi:hypothetical protein